MKRYHNWRGLILILAAILFLLIWPLLAYYSYNINDEDSGIMFLITGGILFIFLLILIPKFYIGFHRETAAKNAFGKLPDKTAEATVSSKSKTIKGNRYSRNTFFYITFEMHDGERKKFQVNHNQYSLIEKYDAGILTFKEGNGYQFFVDFKRKVK